MKYIKVEEIPKAKKYNSLVKDLLEFMGTNIRCAKVDFEREYVSPYSCSNSLRRSIKRSGYPIKVTVRNKEIYLTRTDM